MVRVINVIDFDYKHEGPGFLATFRAVNSKEHCKCADSHNLTVIFGVASFKESDPQ
jgi:hypothetical protein